MATKRSKLELRDKIFVGLLLIIFGGIVLHAPLSVGLGTLFPDVVLLIKSWKEVLMIAAALIALALLARKKQWAVLREPLMLLIIGYALLHLALIPLFYTSTTSTFAGLAIDLRYLLFFSLLYIAIRLYPGLRRTFIATFIVGALVVLVFAVLQVTVLPVDVLKYIGYGDTTIVPYLTVDQNSDYIRINSTLRGPNPLGAYALVVLSLVAAFLARGNQGQLKRPIVVIALLSLGGIVALWASYSRSALVATVVAVGLVLLLTVGRKLPRWAWVSVVVVSLAVGGGLFAARDTAFVSNVLLHENQQGGTEINSNEGHIDSLADGVNRMVQQPLGGGIGSTGSASLYGDQRLIIENQYLFVAHEAGWLGLGLFLYIFWLILRRLWQRRQDWLALGVLASGIGLALIGLLLPVWVDDTVAIIWWGLAAIVIGGRYERKIN